MDCLFASPSPPFSSKVLCSPGWPEIRHISKAGLEFLVPQFPKYWSYKHVPFRTSYKYYFKCIVHLFGWFDFDFSRQGFSV